MVVVALIIDQGCSLATYRRASPHLLMDLALAAWQPDRSKFVQGRYVVNRIR